MNIISILVYCPLTQVFEMPEEEAPDDPVTDPHEEGRGQPGAVVNVTEHPDDRHGAVDLFLRLGPGVGLCPGTGRVSELQGFFIRPFLSDNITADTGKKQKWYVESFWGPVISILALLDYVSRDHVIEIRPSSVRPSVASIISEPGLWSYGMDFFQDEF